MKNQISLNNINVEDNFGPGSLPGCLWWRMAAKFEECANFKLEMHINLSKLTPRHRVLRELERLALIASDGGLDELRHKLFNYRSGDLWVPTGGIEKEKLDIPPLNTILLVGFHNAGKSSLVNLMYSVLGRSGLIPFAQTSSPASSVSNNTGLFMEEHNVLRSMRNGFCVYDTRGFDYDRVEDGIEELSEWMTDGVHHNQLCLRAGDDMLFKDESDAPLSRSSSMFATRRVNCVMVVANIAEIHKALKACDKQPLDALRQLFASSALKNFNENPILILTHGDKLSTEDRIEGRIKICEHLGISEAAGVYDIVCLTEYGLLADEFDSVTAYALSEAVYKALLISDRDHLPKRKLQDWGLLVLSWLMCSIAGFFAFLARIFSTLGQMNKMKL